MEFLGTIAFLVFIILFVRLVIKTRKRDATLRVSSLTEDLPQNPDIQTVARPLSYVHSPVAKRNEGLVPRPSSNAEEAEVYVTRALSVLGSNYIIFTNLIIRKPGLVQTAEIDHLVISPFGIFCIETKSHVGSVYGSAAEPEWKQYLQGTGYPLRSPLFQNGNHIKALRTLLDGKLKSKIHNIVVFPNISKLKVNSPLVFTRCEDIVALIDKHRTIVYSNKEMADIVYLLARYTHDYDKLQDEHIQNVTHYMNR